MPTLYYSPETRATRINNAHPEGKVPYLITDEGEHIRESAAIMMYLDELYGAPFGIPAGQKGRGAFLSWMTYYGGVLEPAMVAHFAGIDHPMIKSTFRTMKEVSDHIVTGLGDKPFLLGDKMTIADMIVASTFQWAPHLTPDYDTVRAWLKRVNDAQDGAALQAYEIRAKEAMLPVT
jgi:glutathione S-transferase